MSNVESTKTRYWEKMLLLCYDATSRKGLEKRTTEGIISLQPAGSMTKIRFWRKSRKLVTEPKCS